MRQFYNLTKTIKDTLEANSQVNVVTFGDIFDIDLNKQTIFPLSHIMVNQAIYGTNNEQDILNTQLAVINDLVSKMRKGTLYTDLYQLDGNPTCLPFSERFENLLAGWTATFDVLLPNTEISTC